VDGAVAAQSRTGEAEIASASTAVSVDGAAAASPWLTPTQLLALRASGRQVTWGKMGKGRWRQGTGAKDVEEGSAAVAVPSMPGGSETSSASIAVAMEGAASVGGKSDAAAEDGADIESCMFKKVGLLPQTQNRSCGLR